jgi:hypothetical protein
MKNIGRGFTPVHTREQSTISAGEVNVTVEIIHILEAVGY